MCWAEETGERRDKAAMSGPSYYVVCTININHGMCKILVRGAPPEGFSFLRIFPLRISKTVSFTVYYDSGTAFGHSRGSLRSLFAGPLSHIMRLIDAQSVVPRS